MKYFLMTLLSFLVVGCGVFCSSKPPNRATIEDNGGYGGSITLLRMCLQVMQNILQI
jgi:hypothetical protein